MDDIRDAVEAHKLPTSLIMADGHYLSVKESQGSIMSYLRTQVASRPGPMGQVSGAY